MRVELTLLAVTELLHVISFQIKQKIVGIQVLLIKHRDAYVIDKHYVLGEMSFTLLHRFK